MKKRTETKRKLTTRVMNPLNTSIDLQLQYIILVLNANIYKQRLDFSEKSKKS